jgi:lipopolysaccharide export system protein LptC
VAVILCLLPACGPGTRTEQAEVEPALKLERVRFRVWRNDVLRVRGEAREVTLLRDSGQLAATDLRAELPAQGAVTVVTAPRAHGLVSTQEYTAEGGVVVTHGDERAVTDRARWQPLPGGQGIVSGDDPVEVERQGTRLTGVGFTLDPRSGELQIGGPVKTLSTRGKK